MSRWSRIKTRLERLDNVDIFRHSTRQHQSKSMKSNTAAVFFVLALSAMMVDVRCSDEEDDASVVIAASFGEDGNFPESENRSMQCRATEVYSECNANPMCQRTCDTINQLAVPCPKRTCIEGCVCKPKFVRSELYGGCIPQDQCGRVRH